MNEMASIATIAANNSSNGNSNLDNFYANFDCRQRAADLVERCVIMYRDENGYGLTVGGDNPVLVESVKPGGGAAKAGIRPGDKILKINGTCVLNYSHMDVVDIISTSSDHIALTLSGSPVKRYFRSSRSERQIMQPPRATSPNANSTIPGPSNGCRPSSSLIFQPSFPCQNGAQTKRASLAGILDYNANLKHQITSPKPATPSIDSTDSTKIIQRKNSNVPKNAANQRSSTVAPSSKQNFSKSFDSSSPKLKNLSQNSPSRSLSPGSYLNSCQKNENAAKFGSKILNKSLSEKAPKLSRQDQKRQQGGSTIDAFSGDYHFVATAQISVMDESDSDTEAVVPLDTEGPFSNFAELKNRPAHLAVFLHYLLSNSDPSSLLFFIISDLYSLVNNSKDSRRWAYEIHSTFLTPTAPLKITSIDMPVVQEIDTIIMMLAVGQKSSISNNNETIYEQQQQQTTIAEQNDENWKKIFVKARQKALDEINDLLADFRNKRMLGLGNVYGESRLNGLTPGDQNRERKIIDSLLSQHFESFFNGRTDFEQLSDRQQALAISLATILKHLNVKPGNMYHENLLDKCPIFVAKEKKSFNLLAKPTKKPAQVKGHSLLLTPIWATTICCHCQEVIWGVNPQAYFCSNCDSALHKTCVTLFEEPCNAVRNAKQAPATQRGNAPDALRKAVMATAAAAAVAKSSTAGVNGGCSTPPPIFRSSDEEETSRQPKSFLAAGDATAPLWTSASCSADSGYGGDGNAGEKSAAAAVNVARSQSMKSHQEEQRNLKRNGEPGCRRTKSDVDTDDKSIVLAMGGDERLVAGADLSTAASSPCSSGSGSMLSRTSLPGSPSLAERQPPPTPPDRNADEQKWRLSTSASFCSSPSATTTKTSATTTTTKLSATTTPSQDTSSSSTLTSGVSHQMSASWTSASTLTSLITTATTTPRQDGDFRKIDSDLEVDNEIPHLEDYLHWETVKTLKPKERKRQEVVNARLNSAMKLCVKQSKLIGDIGSMLLGFFDGSSGEKFKSIVSTFCQNQQYALEILKLKQKKDQKFLQFLQEAESSPICRKLQLKDMLPMEMQRLTKYPLLLETIAKYTPEPSPDAENVKRCVWCTKQILDAVNTAKRNFENERRVDELQRRLDTRDFDRLVQQHPNENNLPFKNMDLRKKLLVHDGPLTWRLHKNKAVDLHVVLVDDLLILLSKNSDGHRLCLKYHNVNLSTAGKDDLKFTHCPLLRLNSIIAKSVATDKRAFFIVSTPTTPQGPQIYELVAQTASDKKNWFKLITEQIESCKQRESEQHPSSSVVGSALASPAAAAASSSNGGATPSSPDAGVDRKIADAAVSSPSGGRQDRSESLEGANPDSFPVERIQIISQPRLINPDEVLICQPTVLEHAEPVLTPYEQLKRRDDTIVKSLVEKQRILMEMCGWPEDQMSDRLAEILGDVWAPSGHKMNKDAKEMALAAVVQTNRIIEAINNVMKLKEQQDPAANVEYSSAVAIAASPSVPCSQLTLIVAPLMKYLTGLLPGLQSLEDDLKRVREELRRCKAERRNADVAATTIFDRSSTENADDDDRDATPSTATTPNGGADDDDGLERRREKLKQKRQRNVALIGGGGQSSTTDDSDSLKNE